MKESSISHDLTIKSDSFAFEGKKWRLVSREIMLVWRRTISNAKAHECDRLVDVRSPH
jgi:hypothetical protein